MSDDIIDWLRGLSRQRRAAWGEDGLIGCRYDEAADEIKKLRGLLTEMRTTEAMAKLQEEKIGLCREIERLKAALREIAALPHTICRSVIIARTELERNP